MSSRERSLNSVSGVNREAPSRPLSVINISSCCIEPLPRRVTSCVEKMSCAPWGFELSLLKSETNALRN